MIVMSQNIGVSKNRKGARGSLFDPYLFANILIEEVIQLHPSANTHMAKK